MIEVTGLTKLYDQFVAVNDLSFTARPGEVLGLVGPNGAGKTTTLRCLAGIIPPTRGTIRICGADMTTDSVAAKRQLAFSPTSRDCSIISPSSNTSNSSRASIRSRTPSGSEASCSRNSNLRQNEFVTGELSRGMKQKLVIACGLLHSPRVIFFDEPLTGLDPLGIRRMKDSIVKRAQAGAAIVISSHLLHLVEEICTHLLILKGGRKVADGTLDEVRHKFAELGEGARLEDIFLRATEEPPRIVP